MDKEVTLNSERCCFLDNSLVSEMSACRSRQLHLTTRYQKPPQPQCDLSLAFIPSPLAIALTFNSYSIVPHFRSPTHLSCADHTSPASKNTRRPLPMSARSAPTPPPSPQQLPLHPPNPSITASGPGFSPRIPHSTPSPLSSSVSTSATISPCLIPTYKP